MLPTICADLARTNDDWQEWEFWKFTEALGKCINRNTVPLEDKRKHNPIKRERLY